MSKFKIDKRLSLDFIGSEWGDCYITFNALTVRELEGFTKLAGVDTDDPKSIKESFKHTLEVLQEHFVEGKGISQKGQVDITKEDLEDLPVEAINRAIRFLGEVTTEQKPTQSGE